MIAQTLVILKKEWVDIKSSFFSPHNLMAGIWPVFMFCIAFGIYEPLRLGPNWMQSPLMIFSISLLVPFITIGFISPYSFVGERMRGTLEPLLVTPVSDQAILFGKIGMAVLYGWGITMANMLLGIVILNIFYTNRGFLFFPPGIWIPVVLLSLFVSILIATIGTSSSLYAKTILEAQRNLVMVLFIPIMLPAFFLGPFMPQAWKGLIVQSTAQLGASHFFLVLIILLFVVDCVFIFIALNRFHRKRLMFE